VEAPVKLPDKFSAAGNAEIPDKWWLSFGDEKLNFLVEEALQSNLSLRTAWDRLDRAMALARKGRSSLFPGVEGKAGAARRREKTGENPSTYRTEYSLGLSASYEVDLWGRIRSAYDAEKLEARATREDLKAAAITLSAKIAESWFRLIEQKRQLSLLSNQLETNEKYLEIITEKFRQGQVSATEFLQQQQVVEGTKGRRLLVESSIKLLEHQLAVLLGRAPGDLDIEVPSDLPALPPLPESGLPADLIRRRPDVRAAELRVGAAYREVAAARARRFPTLAFSLNAQTTTEKIKDFFDDWMATLMADLLAPLFDAGERRAEIQRARALLSERMHAYGQTVLTALKEVEDALVQESRQAEYVASIKRQLELSSQTTDQMLEKYTKGTVDYALYLTTLLSHQRLQQDYLTARCNLLLYRIHLYRALAGGWRLPRPPDTKASDLGQPVRVKGNGERG